METLPPVKPHEAVKFEEDVHDVVQAHVVHRTRIPHLVQDAVPLGDLVNSLRCGQYSEVRPKSGRKWVLPGRGYFERDLIAWLVEAKGYRTFRHSRTTYIAPPATAPLPPQAGR
jgi:hypothetical protein